MAKIDRQLLQTLRERTGCGLMDCRKALEGTSGNLEEAIDLLRKKGAAVAAKRAGKETSEGVITSYIHPGDKLGVMIEINCETDFVANTEDLRKFAQDLCMHIAAINPLYLSPEKVDSKFLEHEKSVLKEQLIDSGKPSNIIDQIIEGKVTKLYSDICLLQQKFVKNNKLTVKEMLEELIAKMGESIKIKRFCRFEMGN